MKEFLGDLGGKWTIHWAPLLILMPISVLIELVIRASESSTLGILLLSSQLGYLTMLGYLAIAWWVFYRNGNAPWWVIFPVSAGAGFVLGLSNDSYINLFEQREQSLSVEVDATVIVWTLGLPVMGWIMNKLRQFINTRDSLVSKLNDLNQPKLEFSVDDEFRDLLTSRESMDDTGYQRLAEKLREFTDTEVRPLSHRLWAADIKTRSRFPFWKLVKLAITDNPVPALVYGVVALWLMGVNVVGQFGLINGLMFFAIDILVFVVVLWMFKKASIFRRVTNAFLFPTVATAAIFFVRSFIRPDLTSEQLLIGTAVLWIWLFTSLVFAGGIVQAIKTQNQILTELEQDLLAGETLSYLQQEIQSKGTTDLAKYIHGNVQSRLMAYSLRIQQAVGEGDSDMAVKIRRQAKELIENPLAEYRPRAQKSLPETLLELQESWRGVIEVEIEADEISPELWQPVQEIISEGVSNAYKHGFAKNITISIENTEAGVRIRVIDDGIGPRESAGGYGLRMVRDQTNDNFSLDLSENGEGSTLTALVPNRSSDD